MAPRDSLVNARGRLTAALLIAAIVLSISLIQQILSTVLSYIVLIGQLGGANEATSAFSGLLRGTVVGLLPFSIGVFLCTWLVKPVAGEPRLTLVIWRSLVAAGAGAVVVFVATLVESLFTGFDTSAGFVFGWATGAAVTAASNAGWAITQALYSALMMAVNLAPLTVLAGILVWLWLRAKPVASPVESNNAEV